MVHCITKGKCPTVEEWLGRTLLKRDDYTRTQLNSRGRRKKDKIEEEKRGAEEEEEKVKRLPRVDLSRFSSGVSSFWKPSVKSPARSFI